MLNIRWIFNLVTGGMLLRPRLNWVQVTHICVGNLNIIGPDNGLSPGRRQTIIWTNAGILLVGPLGTNFSEILIEIHTFWFNKMRCKLSSEKWRPFCLGLNVLIPHFHEWYNLYVSQDTRVIKWWGSFCFLGMTSTNERRRYNVTSSFTGWAHILVPRIIPGMHCIWRNRDNSSRLKIWTHKWQTCCPLLHAISNDVGKTKIALNSNSQKTHSIRYRGGSGGGCDAFNFPLLLALCDVILMFLALFTATLGGVLRLFLLRFWFNSSQIRFKFPSEVKKKSDVSQKQHSNPDRDGQTSH